MLKERSNYQYNFSVDQAAFATAFLFFLKTVANLLVTFFYLFVKPKITPQDKKEYQPFFPTHFSGTEKSSKFSHQIMEKVCSIRQSHWFCFVAVTFCRWCSGWIWDVWSGSVGESSFDWGISMHTFSNLLKVSFIECRQSTEFFVANEEMLVLRWSTC